MNYFYTFHRLSFIFWIATGWVPNRIVNNIEKMVYHKKATKNETETIIIDSEDDEDF